MLFKGPESPGSFKSTNIYQQKIEGSGCEFRNLVVHLFGIHIFKISLRTSVHAIKLYYVTVFFVGHSVRITLHRFCWIFSRISIQIKFSSKCLKGFNLKPVPMNLSGEFLHVFLTHFVSIETSIYTKICVYFVLCMGMCYLGEGCLIVFSVLELQPIPVLHKSVQKWHKNKM